ncbi:MAG TPA: OmpH family outer membrane protein [Vicinamibacteria bacterium]
MRKTFVAVLLLAAPLAQAQEPKTPKIAVIDMGRVSAESLLGKGYSAQLEALKNEIDSEANKKQADLAKMDQAIKAIQDDLEKQGSVLSPEAADKKRGEIVKKQRDRQAFLEDGQADLQRMRERAQQQAQVLNNEFQVKIKPHIDAVSKEKAIDILLDGQVTLTVNRDYDISRDVIVKSDEAEKTSKAAAPAAKPATPPATPAKP